MLSTWPYNTSRWQRLRKSLLSREPLCRYCYADGRATRASVVDHIVPVRADRFRAFEIDNLQPLCDPCHNGAKQHEERTGTKRGVSVDGIPLSGWSE